MTALDWRFFIFRNLSMSCNKSSPRYSPYGAIILDIVKVQLLSHATSINPSFIFL